MGGADEAVALAVDEGAVQVARQVEGGGAAVVAVVAVGVGDGVAVADVDVDVPERAGHGGLIRESSLVDGALHGPVDHGQQRPEPSLEGLALALVVVFAADVGACMALAVLTVGVLTQVVPGVEDLPRARVDPDDPVSARLIRRELDHHGGDGALSVRRVCQVNPVFRAGLDGRGRGGGPAAVFEVVTGGRDGVLGLDGGRGRQPVRVRQTRRPHEEASAAVDAQAHPAALHVERAVLLQEVHVPQVRRLDHQGVVEAGGGQAEQVGDVRAHPHGGFPHLRFLCARSTDADSWAECHGGGAGLLIEQRGPPRMGTRPPLPSGVCAGEGGLDVAGDPAGRR